MSDDQTPWRGRRPLVRYWILDAHGEPVAIDDPFAWGRWMHDANRVVERTVIDARILVSTVFLGLDHNHLAFIHDDPDAPPILWETMLFAHNGWPADDHGVDWGGFEHERYISRAAAVKGHRRLCNVATRRLQEYDAAHSGGT